MSILITEDNVRRATVAFYSAAKIPYNISYSDIDILEKGTIGIIAALKEIDEVLPCAGFKQENIFKCLYQYKKEKEKRSKQCQ